MLKEIMVNRHLASHSLAHLHDGGKKYIAIYSPFLSVESGARRGG